VRSKVENVDSWVAKTGTTTVALCTEDGAVVATDRQASEKSGLIASQTVVKAEPVSEQALLTVCGRLAPAQQLVKFVNLRATQFKSRRGRQITVSELIEMVSTMLFSQPALVRPLIAGVDDEGSHVAKLDFVGSSISSEYDASGSGTRHALTVFDQRYTPGLSAVEGALLARDAVSSAKERDSYTGGGLILGTVSQNSGISMYQYDTFPDEKTVRDEVETN
jgi:proteasome beta subunit